MELISPKIVRQKIEKKEQGPFADIIDKLPNGGALKINPDQWRRKESIPHYFLTRYRGRVSVRRLDDECYYVIKIRENKIEEHPTTVGIRI